MQMFCYYMLLKAVAIFVIFNIRKGASYNVLSSVIQLLNDAILTIPTISGRYIP
jgi:hypothetical protein